MQQRRTGLQRIASLAALLLEAAVTFLLNVRRSGAPIAIGPALANRLPATLTVATLNL